MDTGSSLDERRARTQERERARKAQEQRRKAQLLRKKAEQKQHAQNMDALVAQLSNPGMSLTDEGASYARRRQLEAEDAELAALFGKAMTGVRTAGTKKPKGKGKAKQRTPVKSRGYTADRSVIQSGQLDEVVRGMGSGSYALARQREATGRSGQVEDRRRKMGMGMPRRKSRKSRRKSRKSRRKSRKSRRKSRKSRRKSRKSRRKASRKKSRRKSKSRRKASRKKSKRRKSRRKSKSRRKASRKKSRRKSRRKVYG